ncbi:MAG: hypothetical protein AAB276_06570 [Pseudomonadota bacterium]
MPFDSYTRISDEKKVLGIVDFSILTFGNIVDENEVTMWRPEREKTTRKDRDLFSRRVAAFNSEQPLNKFAHRINGVTISLWGSNLGHIRSKLKTNRFVSGLGDGGQEIVFCEKCDTERQIDLVFLCPIYIAHKDYCLSDLAPENMSKYGENRARSGSFARRHKDTSLTAIKYLSNPNFDTVRTDSLNLALNVRKYGPSFTIFQQVRDLGERQIIGGLSSYGVVYFHTDSHTSNHMRSICFVVVSDNHQEVVNTAASCIIRAFAPNTPISFMNGTIPEKYIRNEVSFDRPSLRKFMSDIGYFMRRNLD